MSIDRVLLCGVVNLIDFCPGEKSLVTCSSHEPSNHRGTHRVVLNIFDARTGKIMKDFNERADDFAFGETGGFTGVYWPVFSYGKEKLSMERQIY
ncbi:putative eukaryotic translation initiation factor 3 subunit B [Helianthus anomalus]